MKFYNLSFYKKKEVKLQHLSTRLFARAGLNFLKTCLVSLWLALKEAVAASFVSKLFRCASIRRLTWTRTLDKDKDKDKDRLTWTRTRDKYKDKDKLDLDRRRLSLRLDCGQDKPVDRTLNWTQEFQLWTSRASGTHQNVENNKRDDWKDNVQDCVHPKHIDVQVPVVDLKSKFSQTFSDIFFPPSTHWEQVWAGRGDRRGSWKRITVGESLWRSCWKLWWSWSQQSGST